MPDKWPCEYAGCYREAAVDVRTGSVLTPFVVNRLCRKHCDEHWAHVAAAVSANVIHYTIMPVGAFDLETGRLVGDDGG